MSFKAAAATHRNGWMASMRFSLRNLFFALTNSAKLELQETVLQAYQQQIDPNYTPKQGYEEQGILQEVQHQREYYPQPPYPEPQYPDWVNDCDDGMLPMEMGGM